MSIRNRPVIPDLRLFEANNISRERGRKRRDELTEQGVINPTHTKTGRCLLTIEDAERLEEAL